MRSRNGVLAALIVSVVLNLALVGFIAARIGAPERVLMGPAFGPFRALRELPEARREQLRPMMREHFREIRPNIREIRRAQRAIDDALTAEPFDRARLASSLAEFRRALLASQTASHEALGALAEALTAEERSLLHASMTRRGHDRGRRGDRPSPPGEACTDRAPH